MFKKIPSLKLSFKKKFFFLLFYQASNPYIGKLSILDDELALNVCITKNSKEKFQKLLISFCVFVFATFRQAGPVQLKSGLHGAFNDSRSSLWEVHGFLNIPSANRGRRFRRRLEWLIICRCHSKGSRFSSVILRPWMLVKCGNWTVNLRHGSLGLYNTS